jgi:hypothetical protein
VSLSYGQRRPLQPGTPLQLADGEQLRGVDFRLPRGSAIAGRVFDEDGEPMPAATVRLTRLQYVQGNRQLVQAGSAQTDDRGQYRVWGLMPGEYYVSAVARPIDSGPSRGGRGGAPFGPGRGRAGFSAAGAAADGTDDDHVDYAPTFYPGVMSPSEARAVNVALSAEVLDIDFGVMLVATSTVSGRLVTPDGSAPPRGMVSLLPEGSGGVGAGPPYQGPVRPDGSFSVMRVAPGRYILRAQTGGRGGVPAFAAQPLTVTGAADITDVVVTLAPGATLAGRIVFTTSSSASRDLQQVRVTLPAAEPGGFPGRGSARIESDGTFAIENVPAGLRWLRTQAPRGWALLSAIVDGRDASDEPLDIRAGQRINGITITFTDRVAEINGTVSSDRGAPVSEYTVLAFSTDRARWRAESRHIVPVRPDQNGRYQLRGLPPGEYYVAVIDPAEPGQWFDPAYLEEQVTGAARLTLAESGVRTQDLKIATR